MLWLTLVLLTTEGAVSPADGDAGALARLGICLHVVAECGCHAVVLAHVEDAVVPEDLWVHQSVAGLKAVGHDDDIGTLGFVQVLLFSVAVWVDVRTVVRLTAGEVGGIIWMSRVDVVMPSLNIVSEVRTSYFADN